MGSGDSEGKQGAGLLARLSAPETLRALRICVTYAVSSIAISFIYKAILSVWGFDGKFLLLTAQVVVSLAFCFGLMAVSPGTARSLGLEPVDAHVLRKSVPLGVTFVANIAVGWFGLQLVNIPMFLAIRRTATAFVLLGEFVILGRVPSSTVASGVAIIVLGTLIAGSETFQSDYVGFAYTIGNNIITAVQLSYASRFKQETGVKGFGLVLYNGITALPLAVVGAWLRGELEVAASFPHLADPRFLLAVAVASAMGCFMTYIVLLCATVNSPTVTSVTGNVKDVASTLLGAQLFAGFRPTAVVLLGLAISFSGSGIFTYGKLMGGESPEKGAPAADGATARMLPEEGHKEGDDDADGDTTTGAEDSNPEKKVSARKPVPA